MGLGRSFSIAEPLLAAPHGLKLNSPEVVKCQKDFPFRVIK